MVRRGGLPKLPVSSAKPKLALPKLPTVEVDADSTSTSAASTIAKKAPSITTAKLAPVTRAEPVLPKPDLVIKAEPVPVVELVLPELYLEIKDEPVAPAADKADKAEAAESSPAAEVADEVVSVRDQAIDALRGAGFFDRPIIGRSPEELSDEDLNELLAELARRNLVSEVTGADIRDVKDADFGNLLDTTQHQVIEDVLGIPLDTLTPVGRSLVESELRDTTGTSSQMFNDLLDDLVAGTNNAGFIRPTDGWSGGAVGGATIVDGGAKETSTGGSDGGTDQGSSGGDGSSGTGGGSDLDLGFDPTGRFGSIGGDSTTGGTGGSTDGGSGGTDTGGSEGGESSSGGSTDSGSTTSGGGGSGSGSEGNGDEQMHVLVVQTAEGSTSYTYYEREDGSMYVVGSDGTTREASSEEVEVWGSGESDDDDDDDDDSSSGDAGDAEPSAGFTPSEDGVNFGDPFGLLPERQIVFEDDGATDPTDDGGTGGAADPGYVRPMPDVSQPVDQDTRYVDLRNLTFSPPDDGVTDPVDGMAGFAAIDDAASAAFAAFDAPSFAARSFEGESDDADDAAATDDDGPDFGLPDFG